MLAGRGNDSQVTYFEHLAACQSVEGGLGKNENVLWMPSACLIRMIVGAILRLCSRKER